MTDRDLLELIATQVGTLTKDMAVVKQELREVKDRVIRIEVEHGQKINVLLDGFKIHSQKLDMLWDEVASHKEILKRVK